MADLADPDYGAACYRSRDSLKNFCIRVKFKKITSSFSSDDQKTNNPDADDYVFHWQEKVFSPGERQRYADKENCMTVLENKYHENIMQLKKSKRGFPTKRIFSYTDSDAFVKMQKKFTTSEKEDKSYLSSRMSELRRRTNIGSKKDGSSKPPVPKYNLVIDAPTEEQKKTRHFLAPPSQVMYIMADLTHADDSEDAPQVTPDERDEVVLCAIQVDESGVISVKPDFNDNTKPYRVESAVGRESYEYSLIHSSKHIHRDEQEREQKMLQEIYSRHNELLRAMIGSEFDVPPQDVMKLVVLGEIVSASHFEFSDLYVHFFVDLPQNWSTSPQTQLSGTTQLCRCDVKSRHDGSIMEDVAYFGFPFEFELFYTKSIVEEQSSDSLPRWPTMFFEVLSLDSWTRYRTEGYGHLTLPNTPGGSHHVAECWRPVGSSVVNELRRFFVGGTPELEDLTFSSVPSTFEGNYLGKYGFRTESTGRVNFRLQCIQQSRAFLDVRLSKKSARSLIDRFGGSTRHSSVMQVINAFRKARERMMTVRENFVPLRSAPNGHVTTAAGDEDSGDEAYY